MLDVIRNEFKNADVNEVAAVGVFYLYQLQAYDVKNIDVTLRCVLQRDIFQRLTPL